MKTTVCRALTFRNVVDYCEFHAMDVVVLGSLYEQSHDAHSVHVVRDAFRPCDATLHPPSARRCLVIGECRAHAVISG
jgi:hypothetical protein